MHNWTRNSSFNVTVKNNIHFDVALCIKCAINILNYCSSFTIRCDIYADFKRGIRRDVVYGLVKVFGLVGAVPNIMYVTIMSVLLP